MLVVLPAGAGAPRDFMAPSTCGGLFCQASPEPASARLGPDLELRQGLTFHFYVPCLVACDDHFHRWAERATKCVRALLDARPASSACSTISAVNDRNSNQTRKQ